MARFVKFQEGATGIARAVTDQGSLFHFRLAYVSAALEASSLDGLCADGSIPDIPFEIPEDVLELATGALEAEKKALSLLARAEQHRAGLERKLGAKGLSRWCLRQALDHLESGGMLSDRRYACSWIRQRLRGHIEGPRMLSAKLSSRGVDSVAIREALSEVLATEERIPIIVRAMVAMRKEGLDGRVIRTRLIEMGWRSSEIDDAADSLD